MGAALPLLLPTITAVPNVGPHAAPPTWCAAAEQELELSFRKLLHKDGRLPRTGPRHLEQAGDLHSTSQALAHQADPCCEGHQALAQGKNRRHKTRLQLAIVKEILLQLEAAQEFRNLTANELELRRRLKARSMGLAAIEKARIRQKSRLTNIRCGDANTKLFHIRASSRAKKKAQR